VPYNTWSAPSPLTKVAIITVAAIREACTKLLSEIPGAAWDGLIHAQTVRYTLQRK